MAKKFDYLVEEGMLFTNKKIFGDNEEHEYDVYCQDGRAIAIPAIGELLERPKSPRFLLCGNIFWICRGRLPGNTMWSWTGGISAPWFFRMRK